ncbi:MAG: carboxypeptidase-like regulatory domain-containing protein [Bacillota bacterium]
MADNDRVRQAVTREVNWYASMTVPAATADVEVFARVEQLRPRLLDDFVLRIDAEIRVFAVARNFPRLHGKLAENGSTSSTLVNMPVFVKLPNLAAFEDLLSIRHQIETSSTGVRSGRVSSSGILTLNVYYQSTASLNGTVTEFQHGRPLRGSQLTLLSFEDESVLTTTTAGSDGKYVFYDVRPGTYKVEVAAADYETQVQVAVINYRDTVDFVLHRKLDA